MPQTHQDHKFTLTIVVSGHPLTEDFPSNQRLEQIVGRVLKQTNNTGQDPSSWELRDSNGNVLNLNLTAAEAGLHDGVTLFLNPRAGAGG